MLDTSPVTPSLMMLWFLALLTFHWMGDFVNQSRWMADNKSKSIVALSAHVAVYTLTLAIGCVLTSGLPWGMNMVYFLLVNGAAHWATDFVTSRFTSYFYRKQKVSAFFTVIGFDQLLHTITIGVTLLYFFDPQWR